MPSRRTRTGSYSRRADCLYVPNHTSSKITVLNASNTKRSSKCSRWERPRTHIHLARRQPPGGHELQRQRGLRRQHRDRQASRDDPGREEPLDIEYSPDGRYIYTANNEDNAVSVIDAAANRVIGKIKTGKQPTSIACCPTGARPTSPTRATAPSKS